MRVAKDDQFGDIERNRLIKHSKRIGQNERESLKLRPNYVIWWNYRTKLSYFLKYRENAESKNPKVSKTNK